MYTHNIYIIYDKTMKQKDEEKKNKTINLFK